MQIPERDWKVWKPLFDAALQRFCEHTLERAASIAEDNAGTAHERYIRLYRYIRKRDKEIDSLFDGFSRSRAQLQLALAFKKGLITPEELSRFSDETQSIVSSLVGGSLE